MIKSLTKAQKSVFKQIPQGTHNENDLIGVQISKSQLLSLASKGVLVRKNVAGVITYYKQ
jgi:hypothetical protein